MNARHRIFAAPAAEAADLAMFRRHGGRLGAAQACFPQAPRPWLDLSTGINPRAYPLAPFRPEALKRLPDPAALARAEAAAARVFGVTRDRVAATSGGEGALRLLPWLLERRRVAIAADTYGGHEEAWRAAGAQVVRDPEAADAWVVVNPNNPDGAVTSSAAILHSANRRWTIVDEAFADAHPEVSVAAQAGGRLVVLRSFGKFYGLPGLRLGFVLAAPELIAKIRLAQGDWPVGPEAIAVASHAYADEAWASRTRTRLAAGAARLDRLLTRAGLEILGGTSLFRLARSPAAAHVFLQLARAGVRCRPFDDPARLRFGLPSACREWARLTSALTGDPP
jgi:cobalamin biosynthetic protein CobC